ARSQAAADQLNPLVEPIILYFHRRGLQRAIREDMVMTLAEQQGLVKRAATPADLLMAVVLSIFPASRHWPRPWATSLLPAFSNASPKSYAFPSEPGAVASSSRSGTPSCWSFLTPSRQLPARSRSRHAQPKSRSSPPCGRASTTA